MLSWLRHFYEQELIDDVLYVAKSGREAMVYCIHGDLSAYNILYWQGAATIIDFAQAVDLLERREAERLDRLLLTSA